MLLNINHHLFLALFLLSDASLLDFQSYTMLALDQETGIQGGKLCLILSALSESSIARVYTNRLQRTLNFVWFDADDF